MRGTAITPVSNNGENMSVETNNTETTTEQTPAPSNEQKGSLLELLANLGDDAPTGAREFEPAKPTAGDDDDDDDTQDATDATDTKTPPLPAGESTPQEPPSEYETLAAQYGVDANSLKQFSTPQDAANYLALRDRELFAAGQQYEQQYAPQPQQPYPQQPFAPQPGFQPPIAPPQPFPQQPAPPAQPNLPQQVNWEELGIDPDAAKAVFQPMHDELLQLRQQVGNLYAVQQQAVMQQQQQQAEQMLGQIKTSLMKHNPARYGEPGRQLPSQQIAMQAALQGVATITTGMQMRGIPFDMNLEALARRADHLQFFEDNQKQALIEAQSAVKAQAQRKLGNPGGSRQSAGQDLYIPGKSLAEQPAYLRALDEAGATL